MTTVSVIIAAHPARARNGLLGEAVNSVWAQTGLTGLFVLAFVWFVLVR